MNRTTGLFTAALLLAFATTSGAQHGAPSGHGPGTAGGHGAGGEHTGHRSADSCEKEFEQVVADGRGFGMAFAADRHGYPGPLHVLELATRLGLTPDQQTKVRALQDAMFAESRPKGAALLAAERKLGDMFASAKADEAGVRAAVHEVERLRADLRALHLTMHLKTREVLSPEQRRLYHAERWGTTAR